MLGVDTICPEMRDALKIEQAYNMLPSDLSIKFKESTPTTVKAVAERVDHYEAATLAITGKLHESQAAQKTRETSKGSSKGSTKEL